MAFSFENLIVYQKSLIWVKSAEDLCRSPNQASPNLLNQLSRASLSVPLNIAEGNGRWHKAEKRQFLWIARGSVFECVSILQVMKSCGDIEEIQFSGLYAQLEELAKMLSALIKTIENLKLSA